jgi:Leucine rich repeat
MIRLKCPRCDQPVTFEKPPADGLVACACGQKLRLKLPTAKPVAPPVQAKAVNGAGGPPPARAAGSPPAKVARPRPVEEDPEELEEAVLIDEGEDEAAPPAPPRKRPRPVVVDDGDGDEEEAPVVRRAKRPKFAPLDEDQAEPEPEPEAEEEEEPRPKKRRKKKKKKKDGPPDIKGAHVALIGGGIVFVLLLTGGLYFMWKGGSSKPKADPQAVIAEINQVGGNIQRDPNTQEVVQIGLVGTEGRGYLLGKIKDAFPNLRTLDLSNTKVADVDLEHLEGYTGLRVLRLGNTKVTSGGMQFLKDMTGLEELDLGGTLVTDAGLEQLKGLKGLKRLNLSNTPLASGRGLAAAIPGLEVTN